MKSDKSGRRDPLAIDWGDATFGLLTPNGEFRQTPDLLRALESSLAGHGTVVFKGGPPIELKAGAGLSLVGRGTVQIEGLAGAPALLKVELDGTSPFLSTGSGVNLKLRNLTIEAHWKPSPEAAKKAGSPPPLIMASGRTDVERCSFRTSALAGHAGSRALLAVGGAVVVDSCWFEGFEDAIELRAMAGIRHALRRSIFVPGGTPSAAVAEGRPVRRGWPCRVVFEAGGARGGGRTVGLDHCTVAAEGMLRLIGFSESSPIQVNVSGCAAQVDRLLEWSPKPPEAPWSRQAVVWAGLDNQLDVTGDAWVAGTSAPNVAGLDDWAKLVDERNPIRPSIRFAMAPETPDGRLTPEAYSLLNPPTPIPGAPPREVGPPSP